ncbi:MAG: HesA/MoeB/ThiF family protein [Bacteroidota bacterium]
MRTAYFAKHSITRIVYNKRLSMNNPLTDQEQRRYKYHLLLEEIGIQGQEKIKNTKILVVGAGGIGSPALQYLTASGFGHIGIIDFDQVTESNLQRQILYGGSDLGKLKSIVAKQKLEQMNTMIDYKVFNIKITRENASRFIKDFDIIIDATDNYEAKYLLNDVCVELNKIFIFGAIYKFEGQVGVFNYKNGPQLRDAFPEQPVQTTEETGILGIIPGIIGLFQVNEAIKIATGIGENLSGKLLIFNAINNDFQLINIKKK